MQNHLLTDPKVLRFLLQQHLSAFIQRAFCEVEPSHDFIRSAFIEVLVDKLLRIDRGEVRRQIINLPPRHLKSFIVSVCYVAWALGHDPGLRVVLVSYSADLSERHARLIRQILKSEWYRKTFPRTQISKTKDTNLTFETTEGGSVFATTIEGQLTGRGGDLFIIDDPIKSQDIHYDRALTSVNDWVSNTLLSRIDNKAKGKVIVVMQRLHVNDLTGHLVQRGGWNVLAMPAKAIKDEAYAMLNGKVFRRQCDEPLFPERETLEILERQREAMGSVNFEPQYQQEPVSPEGCLLDVAWLKYYDELPPEHVFDEVIHSWDLGVKDGNLNDYSACTIMRWSYTQRKFYLLHVWRGRVKFPELKAKIIALAEAFPPKRILIEDAATASAVVDDLRTKVDYCFRLVKPEGAKVNRILNQSHKMEAGQLLIPRAAPWLADFLEEFRAFPNGRYDDMLDALTYGLASKKTVDPRPALCVFEESPYAKKMRAEGVSLKYQP